MRKSKSGNQIFTSIENKLFHLLVKIQQLFLQSKINPTEINLFLFQFLVLISAIQEIQLISGWSNIELNNNENFSLLFKKYSLNLVNYDGNEVILVILSIIQIGLTTFNLIAILFNEVENINIFFKYFHIIHHLIANLPIMKTTFHYISKNQFVTLSLITLTLSVLQEFQFCFFSIQTRLIEIERGFSNRFSDLMLYFCNMLICYFNSHNMDPAISQYILIFSKLFFLFKNIHNYHHNSEFVQKINIFLVSYAITLLTKQISLCSVLVYLLLFHLIYQIRCRKLSFEIIDQQANLGIFKYHLFENKEFRGSFSKLYDFYIQTQMQSILNFQNQTIKNGEIHDKLLVAQHVFQNNKIQLYLNLINLQKQNLSLFGKIRLNACQMNSIRTCQKLISSALNVNMFIKSLEIEEKNFQILVDCVDAKIWFYKFLIKELPIDQYLWNFSQELQKIMDVLSKSKKSFEKNYDFTKYQLQSYDKSDQVSLNIIKSFYLIFFNNYYKVQELERKQLDLFAYDRITNAKLMKNQALLISISYINQQFKIRNENNKRLRQLFDEKFQSKIFVDHLPSFEKTYYINLIDQYISSGFEIEQPIKLYFEINQFLIEYDLYLYSTISCDDIIIHHFLIQRNQPNHFLLFNTNGKILGISKDIFQYLTQLNEQIQIQDFIQQGMIQYYIPEIVNHVSEFCKIQQQPNTQNYMKIISKWQYPQNHEQCLKYTEYIIKEEKLGTVDIQMLQHTFQQRIQQLVTIKSSEQQLEFYGQLELRLFKSSNFEFNYFILRINEIQNMQQSTVTDENKYFKSKQIIDLKQNHEQNSPEHILVFNQNQYMGLQQDFEFMENIINQQPLYNPLKYIAILTGLMIITSISALIFCYNSNYQSTIFYQEQVTFLQTPQIMTFCTAFPFLLSWNRFCADNDLYELSPYMEQQRKNWIAYVFSYCNQIRQVFTMNLSSRSTDLGFRVVDFIMYAKNGTKQISEIDFYEFYTITQEELLRQYFDSVNNTTPDFTQYKAEGVQRQNILTVLNYHGLVLDDILSQTEESFPKLASENFMILFYLTLIIICSLILFTFINIKTIKIIEKVSKLLRFLNQETIFDFIKQLEWQKDLLSSYQLKQIVKSKPTQSQQQSSEKLIQFSTKVNNLIKIDQYSERYVYSNFMTFLIGIELIVFIFGSQLVAMLYNTPYQNSLILTMQYLKLKNRLDSTVLFGELIKTEQYIPNNNMSLINQQESIQYFIDGINVVLNLSNTMNDELASVSSYNSSFKQRLIDIFNSDLCQTFPQSLIFCDVSRIQLQYYENENYQGFINNGIYGIVQTLNQLCNEEYNHETTNMEYYYNQSYSNYFLHSRIHINFFVEYFMEIQKCLYDCFFDVFTETQILSDALLHQIYIYLVVSSIVFLLLTSLISGLWIRLQYNKLNQIKLIATLFPPFLLQQKGFSKLLYFQLGQIK